ncbi:hypothetical protein [Flexivirga meconopsidis]|uniref:hypothetical protein n=1 Tax=Flexivirga meconopsidis TaxID=2977121 RepID=UPI0022405B53|nr:hypothetical protein [Flexivirga meconopsidis]
MEPLLHLCQARGGFGDLLLERARLGPEGAFESEVLDGRAQQGRNVCEPEPELAERRDGRTRPVWLAA